MAVSEAFSGTATIDGTEWSLTTNTSFVGDADTSDGCFAIRVDLSALAVGDVYELRQYEKIVSGGTQRLAWSCVFADVQGSPHTFSHFLPLLHGWDYTLKKLAGTNRSITWSIVKEP